MLIRYLTLGMAALAGVFALVAAMADVATSATAAATLQPAVLPGLQTGPAPWAAEAANLRTRLRMISLPALAAEGQVVHIHQHLDIFIDGKRTGVPSQIGINSLERFISPLHTHDTTGIVHVESTELRDYTLGQFFDIWGVRLTSSCIGGYCAGAGKTLRLFSNGKQVLADPRALVLTLHQEIALVFGAPSTAPTIPTTFAFPPVY